MKTSPNVILILTDDPGYSATGCYGTQKARTPNIDCLAAEDVIFTDFRIAASICSPSRTALLTGAYPQRAGFYRGINPNRTARWFLDLHPDEITLAEHFRQQGNATHLVSKWHFGKEPKFFDDAKVFAKTLLDRLTQLYTQRVISLIRDQVKGKNPIFLYYAHNDPHTPHQAGRKFRGPSWRRDAGTRLKSIGQMMTTLQETGAAEHTIVIHTSDNEPTVNRYAKPFRGTKYVTFKGAPCPVYFSLAGGDQQGDRFQCERQCYGRLPEVI